MAITERGGVPSARRRGSRLAFAAAIIAGGLLGGVPALTRPASAQVPLPEPGPGAGLSTARESTCVLSEGRAYCWGNGENGALGNGREDWMSQPTPVDSSTVLADVRLTQVASGGSHTCALSSAGRAYCWGLNLAGAVGDGTRINRPVPVAVTTSGALHGAVLVQISADSDHTCALSEVGRAYCWGANHYGQLGDGTSTDRSEPVEARWTPATAGERLITISAGVLSTCALSNAGRAYCWGYNRNGGLGDATTIDRTTPVAVDTTGVLNGVHLVQIHAGEHTCAVSDEPATYCWGRNDYGQVGDGTTVDRLRPMKALAGAIPSSQDVTQVTGGYLHTCVLSQAGAVYCWGSNGESGQLGNGLRGDSSTPVAVSTSGALGGVTVVAIAAGVFHTCAVSDAGRTYCWGANSRGQLGIGGLTDQPTPVAVLPLPERATPPRDVAVQVTGTTATIGWQEPDSLRGGRLLSYTVTMRPGGSQCMTTQLSCQIGGIAADESYSFTVIATTTGGSSARSHKYHLDRP